MTCSGRSSGVYEIYISTWVECDSHSIEPLSSAPHQVEFSNLSPVATEVQLLAECVGDGPLSHGGKRWRQTLELSPVPRWKRKAPARFVENVTHDGNAPPQGGRQRIHVLVTTVPPSAPHEI